MADSAVMQEIIKQLDRLPFDLQRKVLDFAHALAVSLPKGTPGTQLLRFSGTIASDDIQVMMETIKAGCESIDADEW